MQSTTRWIVGMLILIGLTLSACSQHAGTHHKIEPAHVEHLEGSELSRVTLTEKAIERLDVQTERARMADVARSETQRLVIPYSAVLYDEHGKTWVYKSPSPRTYVRHHIEIDYIDGELAVLSDGPPAGTDVVSIGAAELLGTEFEVGH